jgi:hypothetical protein
MDFSFSPEEESWENLPVQFSIGFIYLIEVIIYASMCSRNGSVLELSNLNQILPPVAV